MNRLDSTMSHRWHVAINEYSTAQKDNWPTFMYVAKTMADEIPRMAMLFKSEREGRLPKSHQQCSMQAPVPVKDNHLSCCLGSKCSECPFLIALDRMSGVTPENIDFAKAWTCAAHIVIEGGDPAGEGFILRVDDRMFWDSVYQNLATDEQEQPK